MTEDIYDVLYRYINEKLTLAVASDPGSKGDGIASKLKIRPVSIKGKLLFQAAKTVGTQEMHENTDAQGIVDLIGNMTDDGPRFGQIELKNPEGSATILISRKGHVTIKERRKKAESGNLDGEKAAKASDPNASGLPGTVIPASVLGGPDRVKNHILGEGTPVPFLVELGVMNREGYVVKARYDKFRQINRYLEFVADVLPELKRRSTGTARSGAEGDGGRPAADKSGASSGRRLEIIDFGCGKSYLTFALYHFLHELNGLDVHITGLDLKKDVIEQCSKLARKLGYNDLEFRHGDIADYETTGGVDMVVTLHACDTATDYAIYNAIRWNAGVIMCVPCCQHELNRQIRNADLEPVLKYGVIKERISALMTDAFRAGMLEEKGYKTQILEFIDMEHTPKNLLIRAVKRQSFKSMPTGGNGIPQNPADEDAQGAEASGRKNDYEKLLDALGSELTLHRLIRQDG